MSIGYVPHGYDLLMAERVIIGPYRRRRLGVGEVPEGEDQDKQAEDTDCQIAAVLSGDEKVDVIAEDDRERDFSMLFGLLLLTSLIFFVSPNMRLWPWQRVGVYFFIISVEFVDRIWLGAAVPIDFSHTCFIHYRMRLGYGIFQAFVFGYCMWW
jgi:hypothetical protein